MTVRVKSCVAIMQFYIRMYSFQKYCCLQKVSHDLMIKAVDGKSLPAVIVFSKALEYIKTIVLNYLNEQVEHPNRSILWIVTVPAIWSRAAKQIMRTAAEKVRLNLCIYVTSSYYVCAVSSYIAIALQ